jgi:DNA-binding response OmpR family regulator
MDEIRFQGYVRLTPANIMASQKPWGWIISFACVMFFLFSCMLVISRLRKAKSIPPVEEQKPETNQLLETIILDCKKLLVVYDMKEIKLTPLMCKFFKLLGETPGYYIEYEQLIVGVYESAVNKGKGRLDQLVKRIRDEILVDVPVLQVRSVKGKGFELVVQEGCRLIIK